MIKYILLNAPPRVGKDTLANSFLEFIGGKSSIRVYEFKDGLKAICESIANNVGSPYRVFVNTAAYENYKDKHNEYLGMTPREFMIHVSENFMKPTFGQDVWGKAALRLKAGNGTVFDEGKRKYREDGWIIGLFPDAGFMSEIKPLVDSLEENEEILLIRMHSNGMTFKNDSRDYVYVNNPKVIELDLDIPRLVKKDVEKYYDNLAKGLIKQYNLEKK